MGDGECLRTGLLSNTFTFKSNEWAVSGNESGKMLFLVNANLLKADLPFAITPTTAKEEKGWTVGRGQGEAFWVTFHPGFVQ